jgi:hypothetical protein
MPSIYVVFVVNLSLLHVSVPAIEYQRGLNCLLGSRLNANCSRVLDWLMRILNCSVCPVQKKFVVFVFVKIATLHKFLGENLCSICVIYQISKRVSN